MPEPVPPSAAVEVVRRPTLRLTFHDGAPYSRDRRVYVLRAAAHVEKLCRGTTWRVEVDVDGAAIALVVPDLESELSRAQEVLEGVARRVNGAE